MFVNWWRQLGREGEAAVTITRGQPLANDHGHTLPLEQLGHCCSCRASDMPVLDSALLAEVTRGNQNILEQGEEERGVRGEV